jgi:hypothetical protein
MTGETSAGKVHRLDTFVIPLATALLFLFAAGEALAAGWTVTVRAHQIEALSNSDNWGEQDLYWRAHLNTLTPGSGSAGCDTYDDHPDDANKIKVDWACTATVAGPPDTVVEIKLEVYDEDTIGDDELDLSIDHNQLGLAMRFEPLTSKLTIIGDPTWTPSSCALGRIKRSGFGGGGGEPAEIIFTITASPAGAPDGDSDLDGLPDSWEICGLDGNGDGVVDVNLPAMGADPLRKDLFAEIDWMRAPGGAPPHSHAPWLPAMINAWNELNAALLTNPTVGGVVKPNGIALHLDVGTLYANYTFDIDGNGTPELTVGANGNVNVNGDGIIDIGNLGALGGGTLIGGNVLTEDPLLSPPPPPPPPPPPATPPLPTAAQMFQPGSEFAAIRAGNFVASRDPVFHYVVFGHSYTQVQGGPVNSSGLAEPCVFVPPPAPRNPCNEFMVTLGGLTAPGGGPVRQTVDADRNNVPDGVTVINGPGALPVDGLIGDHVGTFLHELGHNLNLGHGGIDSINWKPNYPSIMNYYWQLPGLSFDWDTNGLGDAVGVDFDQDSIPDVRRYLYSGIGAAAMLNEGVPPPPPPPAPPPQYLSETLPPIPTSRVFTSFTCPAAAAAPGAAGPQIITQRADLAANWDCDAIPNEASVQADINNVNFSSGSAGAAPEQLFGSDDFNTITNGGLNLNRTGISSKEQIQVDSTRQRIVEPSGRQEFLNRCRTPRRIDFENLPPGTVVQNQFGPGVVFLADGMRSPTVSGPADRNHVPTASPSNSLINRPRANAITPLVFTFADPQRVVSLRFGQAGLTNSQRERVRVALSAFDQDGLPMGTLFKDLPLPAAGITELLTAAAIFPDELIRRVELRYEVGLVTGPKGVNPPIAEPVQIDDLVFCGRLDDTGIKPSYPPPPKFGDLPVRLRVQSEALFEVPGSGEPGNTVTVRYPFTGLTVGVDGATFTTDTTVPRKEGQTVKLKAPPTSGVGKFLYWRYDNGVSFGKGVTDIPLTLLRDGTITAVYLGRRYRPRGEEPPAPDRPPDRDPARLKPVRRSTK